MMRSVAQDVPPDYLHLIRCPDRVRASHPRLLADGDPVETLNRFNVLQSTFFDYPALEMPLLVLDQAHIVIRYDLRGRAEETAALQTMQFYERILELSGATCVSSRFLERAWAGDPRTVLELNWQNARD